MWQMCRASEPVIPYVLAAHGVCCRAGGAPMIEGLTPQQQVWQQTLQTWETALQRLRADRRQPHRHAPYTGPERRKVHRDRRLDGILTDVAHANEQLRRAFDR